MNSSKAEITIVLRREIGEKVIFIKITNPQASCALNDMVSDIDIAMEILEDWDKYTAFILRVNMELWAEKVEDQPKRKMDEFEVCTICGAHTGKEMCVDCAWINLVDMYKLSSQGK